MPKDKLFNSPRQISGASQQNVSFHLKYWSRWGACQVWTKSLEVLDLKFIWNDIIDTLDMWLLSSYSIDLDSRKGLNNVFSKQFRISGLPETWIMPYGANVFVDWETDFLFLGEFKITFC